MRSITIIFLLIYLLPFNLSADEGLQKLGKDFFAWRAVTQPATSDDINRVERPDGWYPDYSPKALIEYRQKYNDYKKSLIDLPRLNWTKSDSVDFLIMRSAIERVNWELNVLKLPNRNPNFYIDQSLGALYELLIIHSPMTKQRAKNIITRLNSFEKTLSDAKINLTDPIAIFAEIAIENCQNPRENLYECANALKLLYPDNLQYKLFDSVEKASIALEDYISWLEYNMDSMSDDYLVGREKYEYFLKNIALLPYTPEQLISMGDFAWNRSVAFEHYETMRNSAIPKTELFDSADDQIAQEKIDELLIRKFLEEQNIMTVPDWLKHYKNLKIPDYIKPFMHMGVVDDLTSISRLDEDAVAYIPEPSDDLPYFWRAIAHDPRPIIIHEGIPGHYYQMAISWKHPNPIRRHFFDSGPMEGIGFYVEELMLQFGLFEDRPHTREIIYNFMRLRALRVNIDVNLALGDYSINQAGGYLSSTIPMDYETAIDEAHFFAMTPGQAITYQIGKLQIFDFISDAKVAQRDEFNLRLFHDYLIKNGNVPIALLRWEYLGLDDEIKQLWPKNI
jgi:hypothetical protein